MTKKNELVKKETAELAVPEGGWDDGEFETKDLVPPMILAAQGLSDVVKQGMAKAGDIYESVNKVILGDTKKSLNFIPIKQFKTWINYEMVGNQFEFRNVEQYLPGKYEYEEQRKDGSKWMHQEVLNFYVLLEDELKDETAFPYVLSFRSSNKKKAQPLVVHMARMRALTPARPLCSMKFSLSTVLMTKGKNSWFGYEVKKMGETDSSHMSKALEWLKSLSTKALKYDEVALKEEVHTDEDEREAAPVMKKGEVAKEARY